MIITKIRYIKDTEYYTVIVEQITGDRLIFKTKLSSILIHNYSLDETESCEQLDMSDLDVDSVSTSYHMQGGYGDYELAIELTLKDKSSFVICSLQLKHSHSPIDTVVESYYATSSEVPYKYVPSSK